MSENILKGSRGFFFCLDPKQLSVTVCVVFKVHKISQFIYFSFLCVYTALFEKEITSINFVSMYTIIFKQIFYPKSQFEYWGKLRPSQERRKCITVQKLKPRFISLVEQFQKNAILRHDLG